MNYEFWAEFTKTQGIATVLILVGVAVLWKWWLPEWRKQNALKNELEEKRQKSESEHRENLVRELRDARMEHRQERDNMMAAHREDQRLQHDVFREMVSGIQGAINNQSKEIAKNSALTIAAAEVMGASKVAVAAKASMLYGSTVETESLEAVGQ